MASFVAFVPKVDKFQMTAGNNMPSRGKDFISPQFVIRLLLASYFVALSFHLAPGADLHRLVEPFFSPDLSHLAVQVLVLTLSIMILFDIQRRFAALILSIFVFWASYIEILMGGDVGEFWLNLALIGGLLHAGGVGLANQGVVEVADEVETPKPVVPRRHRTRSMSGRDLPYRKDLEVVREH